MSKPSDNNPQPERTNVIDKNIIATANELLDSLEQSHRSDLTLHLYSTFLLKQLLYKANEKKNWFETDQFIRTQIKNNWTSWPTTRTVVDPETNLLFEDDDTASQEENGHENEGGKVQDRTRLKQGEISPHALIHATNMLKLELNGFWQHHLAQSASMSKDTLDIDKMTVPQKVTDDIINKLDHFFNGLHNKVAIKNKIDIQQDQATRNVTISQLQNDKVHVKKAPVLTYHDIIGQGCEMGEDMVEIYMKSLELYNDIPATLDKSQFKLPKSLLKKYRPAKKGKVGVKVLKKSRETFLEMNKLLRDKRLSAQDKILLRKLSKRSDENAMSKKTFFKVKSYQTEESIKDNYNLDDCLAKIPMA